jgi:hypothetical protein
MYRSRRRRLQVNHFFQKLEFLIGRKLKLHRYQKLLPAQTVYPFLEFLQVILVFHTCWRHGHVTDKKSY